MSEMGVGNIREQMIRAGLWNPDDARDPSQEIGAAWEVVEKMRERGYGVAVEDPDCRGRWRVIFGIEERIKGMGNADTAPLAICKAALNVVSNPTP